MEWKTIGLIYNFCQPLIQVRAQFPRGDSELSLKSHKANTTHSFPFASIKWRIPLIHKLVATLCSELLDWGWHNNHTCYSFLFWHRKRKKIYSVLNGNQMFGTDRSPMSQDVCACIRPCDIMLKRPSKELKRENLSKKASKHGMKQAS